jgi:DNA-binding transcriptional MerR regulator
MAPELISISKFAARHRISLRALRLYEERGLLVTSFPRVKGSRRYYSEKDSLRLATILRLKRCGFSLKEIKDFLPRSLNENFLPPLTKVEEQLDLLEKRKRDLEEGINELGGMRQAIKEKMDAKSSTSRQRRSLN